MAAIQSPIVFCHNDLLCQNIIYCPDRRVVSFIDYEYGCLVERGFDIGNHFCEYAGVEVVDYGKYPSKEHQLSWLRIYLAALHGTESSERGENSKTRGEE